MKSNYFTDCKTIESLKKEYRKQVKINHPDCGGNETVMKAINNEYDYMFNKLKDIHNSKTENENNQNTEQPETFRNIINSLMKLDGLKIEICGSWIWLSGDTYKHKATIKKIGFKWASTKKMWYLGELQRKTRNSLSMDSIRTKYGSNVYQGQGMLCLA